MPPDYGLWLDEDEGSPPAAWPQPAEPNPKDSIALTNPWPWLRPQRYLELMAQDGVLQDQVSTRAEQGDQQMEHRHKIPVRLKRGRATPGWAFAALRRLNTRRKPQSSVCAAILRQSSPGLLY